MAVEDKGAEETTSCRAPLVRSAEDGFAGVMYVIGWLSWRVRTVGATVVATYH